MKLSNRSNRVTMLGLDFGSTTSSAMVATAGVEHSCTTGRMGFGVPQVEYRSKPVFTPFNDDKIDLARLDGYIDQWISESGIRCDTLFSGGVIITGLAAKRINAAALARLIGERIGEAIVATADDPRLESWLAFMGSCSMLSRFHAETPFINIDIGGGTTNPAFGKNGSVLSTGCHFIGARHFQFEPGTYRLISMSPYGKELLNDLGIEKCLGKDLSSQAINAILNFYIDALEAISSGNTDFFSSPTTNRYQQVPFAFESTEAAPVLVFSGGVGELIYLENQGKELPGTTHYGDLGIDLAKRIVQSPLLAAHISDLVPDNQGRATVYGLTLHSTEISGSTIFLPDSDILPRRDLPIVARLPIDADAKQILHALSLVEATPNGACIQVVSGESNAGSPVADMGIPICESLGSVKSFGQHLRDVCMQVNPKQPVVVLVPHNYGLVLGNYASNWRQEPFNLIVIDEIPDRNAHFVTIGRLHNNIVPVSFYGVC
ncbi:MAG: ethanolamine ammonia-lyase reactivating factor EutA [Desulfuromusa sp.]|nr:ethanolamine ammonia-lyase reactivating factor EutA [Desulfuromusa sp.]